MYVISGGKHVSLLALVINLTTIWLVCANDAGNKTKKGNVQQKTKKPFVPKIKPSDPVEFRKKLAAAKNIVVLTSSEISEESGINTTDLLGGSWKVSESLSERQTLLNHPSLVWEYFNYRREKVMSGKPNEAHYAIAALEKSLEGSGKNFTVITSTVDGYHLAAGSKNVVELFGSVLQTQCTRCEAVKYNRARPICQALKGRGDADYNYTLLEIPIMFLPRCKNLTCRGLLRPYVYGISGDFATVKNYSETILDQNDLCIIVGTEFSHHDPEVTGAGLHYTGRTVAQFTKFETIGGFIFPYNFKGNVSEKVPEVLNV